ncbi:MAG: serine/threonine-protein kinase [Myxococcota bacterium]
MAAAPMLSGTPRAYRIVDVVGQGGLATVWRAELLGPGGFVRPVALKMLRPEHAEDAELGQRLRDEARILALVRHRAIVAVDELALLEGTWAVVMELVDGVDLRRLLDQDRVPLPAALEILAEVAAGLDAAHRATGPDGQPLGLVHRDLKPGNLLVTPLGEVKLADFGVARGRFAGREAATTVFSYGSPGYVAPERAELVDVPEGDVYSAGAVLYELVTGTKFGRGSRSPRRHDARVAEAVDAARRQGAPPAVCALVRRMLAFEPDARPCARDVERQARALLGMVAGGTLREWAARALPAVRGGVPPEDHVATTRDHTVWVSTPSPAATRRSAPLGSPSEAQTLLLDDPSAPIPAPPWLPATLGGKR